MVLSRILLALALLMAAAPVAAQTTPETPMTFSVRPDTPAMRRLQAMVDGGDRLIYAAGEITPGTAERFVAFVHDNHITQARVYLDSGGGSFLEGLGLGKAIRDLHFNTDIGAVYDRVGTEPSSMCASACAYAYAGGVNRFLGKFSGKLGIHQFSGAHKKSLTSDIQALSGVLVAYLTEMGVDAKAFTLAAMTAPDSILWLTPEEAETLGFANNGARPTIARVDLVEMVPLLTLSQERYDRKVTIVFGCRAGRLLMEMGIEGDPAGAAAHMRGPVSAYFEFDGQMAMRKEGKDAAALDRGGVYFSRDIDEEVRFRLLKTGMVDGWIENSSDYRWGGPIDIHNVHPQMADFFGQCLSSKRASPALAPVAPPPVVAPPVLARPVVAPPVVSSPHRASPHAQPPAVSPAPAPQQKLGDHDVVVIDVRIGIPDPAIILIDLATVRRTGTSATAVSYSAVIAGNQASYFSNADEYDCANLRVKTRHYYSSRDGVALDSRVQDWRPAMPGTVDNMLVQLGCGTMTAPPDRLLGNVDPFGVLRRYIDKKIYEPRK